MSAERSESDGSNDVARTRAPSTMNSVSDAAPPRCVACAQPRRGHGVTVATYYLARALAGRGLRTLLMDLTGRRPSLQRLTNSAAVPNLTLWTPHIPTPERLADALSRARQQATGRVDVMLLDVDASYLERAGGVAAGIDYILIFTEHSDTGMREVDQLAARLDDEPPSRGSVAAVFSRVSLDSIENLPQATRERGLPVLGEVPADYLLATGDEYSLTSDEPRLPHDSYLGSISRLARALIQIAGIRATGRGVL